MKQLNFTFNTSTNSRKRDVLIEEHVEKNGVVAKTKRRSRYFILNRLHLKRLSDFKKIKSLDLAGHHNKKRHLFIRKLHNSHNGEDSFLCKVAGIFYAVCKTDIYCIAYIHSFKISFTSLVASGGGGSAS